MTNQNRVRPTTQESLHSLVSAGGGDADDGRDPRGRADRRVGVGRRTVVR